MCLHSTLVKAPLLVWRAYHRQILGTMIVSLAGLFIFEVAEFKLRAASMDFMFALRHRLGLDPTNSLRTATIVQVDTITIGDDWRPFVQILDKLVSWGAKAVVFDVVFQAESWNKPEARSAFGGAITNATNKKVKVVFASEGKMEARRDRVSGRDDLVASENLPVEWLLDLVSTLPKDTAIGVSNVRMGLADAVIRLNLSESGYAHDSLALAVRKILHQEATFYRSTNWMNYYGPPGTLGTNTAKNILSGTNDLRSAFEDKVVFVGHGPPSANWQGALDQYKTPFTRDWKTESSGVEIHATAFLNSVAGEWITMPSRAAEWLLLIMVGVLCGICFTYWPLRRAILMGVGGALLTAVVALCLFRASNVVLPWLVIAIPQMVAAIAVSLIPLKSAFVSYRRVDGAHVARAIADRLEQMGVEMYIDMKPHDAGRLRDVLFPQIANRENFLLVVTRGLFTNWKTEGDWIGLEITRALEAGRLIIPVHVDNVEDFISEYYSSSDRPKMPPQLQRALGFKYAPYYSKQVDASIESIARRMRRSFRRDWSRSHDPHLQNR
jgi:CHASE2 domain-containing sensor protein